MRAEFNQDKVDKILQDQEGIPSGEIIPSEEDLPNLVKYLDRCWDEARKAKENHSEPQILANMRQIDGIYDPEKLSAIREIGGSEVFMMITDAKCKNATNWVDELLFQPNITPWDVSPTPIPELPDYALQEIYKEAMVEILGRIKAEAAAQRMQITPQMVLMQVQQALPKIQEQMKDIVYEKARKMAKDISAEIDDKLTEGGWYSALKSAIPNIVMHTGFITGPIPKKRPSIKIRPLPTGKLEAVIVDEVIPTWESRHPLNIYPAPDATNINDGYLFDRIKLTPIAIQELIGVEGYDEDEIRAVLSEIKEGKLKDWLGVDEEKAEIDDTPSLISYDSEKIDGLKFMGAVKGEDLQSWGKVTGPNNEKIDEELYYNIFAYKIGSHIISIQFNTDPLGRKPYYKDSFEEIDGAFWGKGLPQVIKDVQSVCNATARAMVNNVGIASGPQVERNRDRIPPSELQDNKLIPWKVWDVTSDMMAGSAPALKFYQPPMVVNELMLVYTQFSKIADEHSGVPAFAHGDPNVSGAGNALANYEKVLTPSGPVEIGNIRKGDVVVNSYGSTSVVEAVYPQGEKDIYRISFSNGDHIDCDLNHRWSVRCNHANKFNILTTREIIDRGIFRPTMVGPRNPNGYRPKWMLPQIDCVYFEKRDVKIDPYTMGVLIGDGDSRCRVTGIDQEIFDRIPYELGAREQKKDSKAWCHVIKGIKQDYLSYGLGCLTTEKFIPDDYLYNSKENRLELLRGLMDSDGCCSKTGEVYFGSSSYQLIQDCRRLVSSLGATVGKICEEDGGEFVVKGRNSVRKKSYRIQFNIPGERIFHLDRKQSRVKNRQKTHIYITGIEFIGTEKATCISVNANDHLFICENFIVTSNTASGLSMLMGSAARGIKSIIKSIDENIIKPSVERQYVWLIERKDYYGMVCDYQIVSGGTMAALAREQMAARRIEFMNATANPVDAQIMGMEGRKFVLEETAKSVNMNLDKYMPKRQEQLPPPVDPETGQPNFGQTGASAQTLDVSGAPVQGQDVRQFNQG